MGAGLGPVFAVLDMTTTPYAEVKQRLPQSWFKWRQSLMLKLLSYQ